MKPLFRREIRVEHWANALNQGPAAAQAMLDQPISFEPVDARALRDPDIPLETSIGSPSADPTV